MQRLIDANEILKSEHQHYDYMSDEYYVLVRDIENAPTVDTEPVRHGRWKRSKSYKSVIFCDECGEPFELSNSTEHWNYCPNCGAKMDESTMGQVKPSDKEFTLYADEKPIVTYKDSKIVLHGERREDE